MKLIWHIILKDIVRERWALLMWALLFVGQDSIGVFARTSSTLDSDRVVYLQMGSASLVFLQVVIGYVLVARWVQADALIGTSMFWPTRPISAGRLLAAKLLGVLLLFAVLPVLLLLPWWLYCQFGWHEILWTAVDNLGWQLLMIAPAFLVASLTDDLGRVLLWTLLLVIGLLSWVVLLQSSLTGSLGRLSGRAGGSVMFTRLWACSVIFIGGSLAIAAHQFLTRRFARSIVLVVSCLGLVALTGHLWRWNWGRTFASLHQPALAPADPGLMDHLSFAVEPAKGNFGGGFKAKNVDERDASLNLLMRVRGVPDDVAIVAESLNQTWTWDKDMKLTRSSSFYWGNNVSDEVVLRRTFSLPVVQTDPESVRWRRVRAERRNAASNANRAAHGSPPLPVYYYPESPIYEGEGILLHGYSTLPNSYLAKMQAVPPAYRADGPWTLFRPTVVAALPLKDDARASGQARTLRLQRVNGDKPLVISTHASVILYGVWFAAAVEEKFRQWDHRERIAAVNRVTGDINFLWEGQSGSQFLQVGGVLVKWNVLLVRPREVIRNDQDVVADPQWRDHTDLVLLADQDVARFDHTVETAKFELKPEAAAQKP